MDSQYLLAWNAFFSSNLQINFLMRRRKTLPRHLDLPLTSHFSVSSRALSLMFWLLWSIYIDKSRFCIGVVKLLINPNLIEKKRWKLELNNYKKPKYNTLDPLLSLLMCSTIIISGKILSKRKTEQTKWQTLKTNHFYIRRF